MRSYEDIIFVTWSDIWQLDHTIKKYVYTNSEINLRVRFVNYIFLNMVFQDSKYFSLWKKATRIITLFNFNVFMHHFSHQHTTYRIRAAILSVKIAARNKRELDIAWKIAHFGRNVKGYWTTWEITAKSSKYLLLVEYSKYTRKAMSVWKYVLYRLKAIVDPSWR